MASHVKAAKAWLAECLANHPSCSKKPRFNHIWCSDNSHTVQDLEAESSMPKRLLAFDSEPQGEDVVKLIEVKEVLQYFALSHRWGGNETCKATGATLGSMEEDGLKLGDLPRTFRDAVEFTRGMGYAYLWIDSLCIVQDDSKDWQDEARRMACVYGNAIATITALDARDSGTGLFATPTGPISDGESLDRRAWVLQERMIPPRSFVFTKQAVLWECRQADAASQTQKLVLREPGGLDHPKDLFTFFRDWRVPDDSIPDEQNGVMFLDLDDLRGEAEGYEPFLQAWWKFLGKYTVCHLTKDADRFLAMNGIASTTQRWIHMRHFWGIWSPFSLEDLSWCVDREGPPASRPHTFLAPHWSWANTRNGRVTNRFWDRLPVRGVLQLKPEVGIPYGTSFDMPLPHPSWTSVSSMAFELKGPLRNGAVMTSERDEDGKVTYDLVLEPFARFSEEERFEFWPDCAEEFPPDTIADVTFLHMWHYNAEQLEWTRYIDVYLVLQKLNPVRHKRPPLTRKMTKEGKDKNGVNEQSGRVRGKGEIVYAVDGEEKWMELGWNEGDAKDDETEDLYASRTFRRIGYAESTYEKRRHIDGINEDMWWRCLRLL
ncbi:Fc.00g086610.m01.CDS01 [Cosmosporella sp. VM-42]